MAQTIETARARAEAMFRKVDIGASTPVETERTRADRVQREKTARLRALRLAKEASNRSVALSDRENEP